MAAARARHHGIAQSLLMQRQRALLDQVGHLVDSPVIYLKAAWADPTLYSGRGERTGCDVDILVPRQRFVAFSRGLAEVGFQRVVDERRRFSSAVDKEWTFASDRAYLVVDLHRELAERPWFRQDPAACIRRAIRYDTVDGPIMSLCPEDQVVYAAAHHANSLFDLDGRHVEDTRRLVARFPIDWQDVWRRGCAGFLDVPLVLIADALQRSCSSVPCWRARLDRWGRQRLRVAEYFIVKDDSLRRRRRWPKSAEYGFLLPALSGRASALPIFSAQFLVRRTLDWLAIEHARLTSNSSQSSGARHA